MNDQQRAAMQMALEALEVAYSPLIEATPADFSKGVDAITALREALAQPQGEPVALYFGLTPDHTWLSTTESEYHKLKEKYRMKVYTAPPSVEAAIKYREIYEEAVFEATKEKAAKVCEECFTEYANNHGLMLVADKCAAAIRSMK